MDLYNCVTSILIFALGPLCSSSDKMVQRKAPYIIDNYHIPKVEFYSLRRQVGVILQDTLLFDGTEQFRTGQYCIDKP